MMRYAVVASLLLCTALPAHAGNVTRQQGCQLMAQHVIGILESKSWKNEATAQIGVLKLYAAEQGKIIDTEIAASAEELSMSVTEIQGMVDQQGKQIKEVMERRYGTEELYRDYAVALFECAKMSSDRLGSSPETFVATLEQIGDWAQAKK